MKNKTHALSPAHEAMLALPYGLLIGVCNSPEILLDASYALTEQAVQSSSETGLTYPKVQKVRTFVPGSGRHLQYAKARQRYAEKPPEGVVHELVGVGTSSKFNWFGAEGRHAILPLLLPDESSQHPCMNILVQQLDDASDVSLIDTLMQINASAKASNTHVMALLACESETKSNSLLEIGVEYFIVNECEPDFDQDTAFSIDYLGLRPLNRFGIGKVMCNVRYADQRIQHSYSPFVSALPRSRAVWLMRCMGKSYAEIGDAVGYNKSTIMHHLRKLPAVNRNLEVDSKWLEQVLEHLDIEDGLPSRNAKPQTFQEHLDSDEDDYE
jgi:DNA-binding NarL/FixJ family response regulator